jgi:Mg-chelatase subunit ChlD
MICDSEDITQDNQKYTILLIFTDGTINDQENTNEFLEEAKALPISIIIVGIGNGEFSKMYK